MTQLGTEKESARRPLDVMIPGHRPDLSREPLKPMSASAHLKKAPPGIRAMSALLLALLALAGPVAAGTVVAIGGALRDDNHAVWSRLVALAGRQEARYVVFGTASGNPERSAARVVALLESHGAEAESLPVAPKLPGFDAAQAARDPELIARVGAANGVFFTGGAQERIVDTLQPGGRATPLLEAIRGVLDRGGVIAGTSAGAAIMSQVMFRDAPDLLGTMKGTLREGMELDRGLGFAAPGLFVDQHFLRRGRLGRMLPLMQSQGLQTAIGVEENSAAILRGHEVEIVGEGGALFVDLRDAASDAKRGAFNLAGVRLTFLGDGDRLDLRTRTITPSAAKLAGTRIDPSAAGFEPSLEDPPFLLDVLGPGAILRAMSFVLDGPAAEVRGLAYDARPDASAPRDQGFEFRFYRGPDTTGWYADVHGEDAYTIVNVRLDVVPVQVAQPLYKPLQNPQP
jgi:cyanophycinase